jgi:hypothetical protein
MITEKIKTFADVCLANGTTEEEFNAAFSLLPVKFQESAKAHKLVMLAIALNEGWNPDWTNNNQRKYYPWFDHDGEGENGSSGAFVFDVYYDGCSGSFVGSRLVYKTRELAEYAGTQFLDLYKDFFIKGE